MILKILLWLLVIGSLYGQILVTHKKRMGFALWTIVDFGWIIYFGANYKNSESYPQIVLWVVYTILSFWGWLKWKEKSDGNNGS